MEDEDRTDAWRAYAAGSPDSATYANDWYAPNTVFWVHLVTSAPIPGGAWAYINVGTYDYRETALNDVSSDQLMRNWWFFEEIWIESR